MPLLPFPAQIQSTYAQLGGAFQFQLTYDPSSTSPAPPDGFLRFDNVDPNQAGHIYLPSVGGQHEDVTGIVSTTINNQLRKYGVLMYVRWASISDPSRWGIYFPQSYSGASATVTKIAYNTNISTPTTLTNDTVVSFIPSGYPNGPVWLFDASTTTLSGVGNGFFRMNANNPVTATKLGVNGNTMNIGDWTGLWVNLNLTAGPVKARLLLMNLANVFGSSGSQEFAMYELNALVQQTGYMEFDISYVDTTNPGGSTPFGATNDPTLFCFQWVGGGTKYTITTVKTAAYSANVYEFVPVDTTSAAVTVTLPTAPGDGTLVGVKCVKRPGSNNVTVAAGGSDVFNVAGGATTLTLSAVNSGVGLQYSASQAIWYVTDTITT